MFHLGAVPGIKVEVVGSGASATTDASGRYLLPATPGSNVTIKASAASGFVKEKLITGVNAAADQITTLNIALDPRDTINYYVNGATGNDTNSGLSRTAAWKTINANQSKLLPGDIVNVAPGIYIPANSNGVVLTSGGSILRQTIYQKDTGAGSGNVVIDTATVNPDETYKTTVGINIQANNVTVSGFEIKNASWGVLVNNGSAEIANCEIHAIRPGQPGLTAERGLVSSSSHCAAIFNVAVANVSVHNNLIYDVGYPELTNIATCVASPSCTNVKIYNNTLANAQSGIATWNNADSAIEFKNNIVTGMRGFAIDRSYAWAEANSTEATPRLTHESNLYFANATDFGWSDPVMGAGEYNANPKFAAGAYTLDTGSPAINAGVDVGLPFQSTAPDIGAFETSSTAAAPSAVLTGTVTANVTGHPAITRATISVGGVPLGATDDQGKYAIPVAAGTYNLTAARSGFVSGSGSVTVASGGTATRNFDLAKGTPSTWYVNASTGNDANNGQTPSTAWATISRGDVLGVVKPGDTVLIAAGTYEQAANPGAFLGVKLSKCFGEAAAPITYKADGAVVIDQTAVKATDGTNRGIVIDANGIVLDQAASTGKFDITGCQYGVFVESGRSGVTVAGCNTHSIMQAQAGASDYRGSAAGIICAGSVGATVRNNVINVVGQIDNPVDMTAGIMVSEASGSRIYNNTVFGVYRGVYATSNAADTIMRNNIIDYFYTYGIYTECLASEFVHTNNLFHAFDSSSTTYGGRSLPGMGEFVLDVTDSVGFEDYTDFYLGSGSPAINMGADVGLPYNGPAPDLGAHETTQTAFPSQYCTIKGTVRYRANGQPVEGASVSIAGSSSGGVTGPDGTYALVTIENGSWTVQVVKDGYAPKWADLTLVGGTQITQDFYLSPGTGGVWDISQDWSIANPPTGPWSFGESASMDSASVTQLPDSFDYADWTAGPIPGLQIWTHWIGDPANGLGYPQVACNTTDQDGLAGVYPAHAVAMHPGNGTDMGLNYGVARWTAPSAGWYEVYITFGADWFTVQTTDCHVLINGVSVSSGFLDGTGRYVLPYAGRFQFNAGDTVDAFVGNNGTYYSDTTPITFTVIGVDTTPADVASVAEAKAYADNKLVAFTADQIVTVATGTLSDTSVAYVESADRTAGIKIVGATVALGQKVKFQGYMGTDDNGERFISVVSGTLVTNGTGTVKSLGMLNKTITGDKIGLLVRVWGTVTEVDPAGKYVIVDDASGAAIKVMKEATTKTMALGKMVGVTGPASFVADGPTLTTVVRARSNNDIVQYN